MGILDELYNEQQATAQPAAPPPTALPQAQPAAAAPPAHASVLDNLYQEATAQQPGQSAAPSGLTEDIAKSGGIGLAKGLVHFAGAPSDVHSINKAVGEKAADLIGISPETQSKIGGAYDIAAKTGLLGPLGGLGLLTPGSDKIQSAIESKTGKFYQPQTTPGKYTESVGQVVGNPLTYVGGGSLLMKAFMGAGAGVGAEAGGEYGGTPGSIAGSILGALLARRVGSIGSANPVPTRATLREAADQQYTDARALGIAIQPTAVNTLADTIEQNLTNRGFRDIKDIGRPVFRMLEELRDPNRFVYNTDDIQAVRQAMGNIAKASSAKNFGRGTPDRAAALDAVNAIDDFMAHLAPNQVTANAANLPQFNQLMQTARGNYAAAMRSSTLDEMLDRATRQAAKTGKGTNIDNAMRQRVDSIINTPKLRIQYTGQELAAMREIVMGTMARNAARYTGMLSPSGIVSATLGSGLGRAFLGKTGEFLGPAVGYIAKKSADRATEAAVNRINEATRARSPYYTSRYGPYAPPIRPSIVPSVYGSLRGRTEDGP